MHATKRLIILFRLMLYFCMLLLQPQKNVCGLNDVKIKLCKLCLHVIQPLIFLGIKNSDMIVRPNSLYFSIYLFSISRIVILLFKSSINRLMTHAAVSYPLIIGLLCQLNISVPKQLITPVVNVASVFVNKYTNG